MQVSSSRSIINRCKRRHTDTNKVKLLQLLYQRQTTNVNIHNLTCYHNRCRCENTRKLCTNTSPACFVVLESEERVQIVSVHQKGSDANKIPKTFQTFLEKLWQPLCVETFYKAAKTEWMKPQKRNVEKNPRLLRQMHQQQACQDQLITTALTAKLKASDSWLRSKTKVGRRNSERLAGVRGHYFAERLNKTGIVWVHGSMLCLAQE